jgi:hypothetical protein
VSLPRKSFGTEEQRQVPAQLVVALKFHSRHLYALATGLKCSAMARAHWLEVDPLTNVMLVLSKA